MSEPNNTPQGPMRFLSVCSGMEAASVAWEPLGWKAVGFSEIEPFPCAILKHRFPNTPNYGSLTEYQSWPLEPGSIDLLVGGTPCQSFSVAGLRKGLADPRGNLALVFLGLVDRLQPKWVVWENVPGVLSSNGGRDFGSFLGALVQLGYGFAYRVLDAQHFGVPQRRRRVFVVACLGDWRSPAEVLLESDCVRRDIKKGRAKGQGVASGVEGGVGADHPEGCWWDGGQVSQTRDAVLQKGQTMPEKNRFPAVLQPVVIDRAAFNQGQNAQYEPHIAESEVMDSLVARGPHAVGQPIPFRKSKRACSTTDNETWVEADASNTLNNFDLGDTRTTHAVVNPIAIQGTIIGRSETSGPEGLGATENGPMYTLTKTDILGVLYENHPNDSRVTGPHDVAPTVVSRFGTGGGNVPLVNQEPKIIKASELRLTGKITEQDTCPTLLANTKSGDNDPLAVRRLTPTECERLQGFPDNWSRIPWKGKPEDQCPDGPRYRACGNSMAVPVMCWIGEQIARVEAEGK